MKTANSGRLGLVVVGHVDHGKSTLIGRLLLDAGSLPADKIERLRAHGDGPDRIDPAFVTDSLEEEQARGVTIDTAQVFFRTPLREYAIIDTPGHKEFLKNMFTGATRAEAALLVVDAVEGVREQTTRHVGILSMIGIDQLLVAVSKMDSVGFAQERFEALSSELCGLLARFDLKAIVPVAARQGDNVVHRSRNMDWYAGPTILLGLDSFDAAERDNSLPLRLPVQDAYEVDGKLVSVGRIESGRIATGDDVVFRPSGTSSVVESLRGTGGEEVREAEAGQAVGIELTDSQLALPGEVICHGADPIPVTRCLESYVFWLSKRPLSRGERLLFRCATQETDCVVDRLKRQDGPFRDLVAAQTDELREAELGRVVLSTEKLVAVERFADVPQMGRFVLARDHEVAGGGVIVSHRATVSGRGLAAVLRGDALWGNTDG